MPAVVLAALVPSSARATLHVVSGLDPANTYTLTVGGQQVGTGLQAPDGLLRLTSEAVGRFAFSPDGFLANPGGGTPLAVSSRGTDVPRISSVWPHPVRSGGIVQLDLARGETVEVAVYNVGGRKVGILWSGWLPPGRSEIPWTPSRLGGVSAGTYWMRVHGDHGAGPPRKILFLR
jgi:hypothetical protein